jgi:large repetitive protein
LASAELYNPATGVWMFTGSLSIPRQDQIFLSLPTGKVLAAGGENPNALASPEVYDPASGAWSVSGSPATARLAPLTLLPDGEVLASWGLDANSSSVTNTELYDVGLGFTSVWQSKIKGIKNSGNRFQLIGKHFQGISQASSGNTRDSSTNYPIVQLPSIDSGRVAFLPVDSHRGWSDTSFTSARSALSLRDRRC